MSEQGPEARLTLKATISPSEDEEKVISALKEIGGDEQAALSIGPGSAKLTTTNGKALVRLRDQLRDRRIRSAARRQMITGRSGHSTSLMLNRQAAAAGVVALCGSEEESALGPIYLIIESSDLEKIIDMLSGYSEA